MYKEYFGLKELPFSITPDPRYLYMSEKHREALAHLVYGISSDGGFILLTGEVGTGKSTICRCLLEQLPKNTDIAFILNPKVTVEELLATVCDELCIYYPEGITSVKVFVDRINAYLLNAHARGRKTVLIIEEAQNLGTDVLEQVRLLTNLETNQLKLLQIIMVGQPELKELLSRSDMRQLAQRITARYHLGPLSKKEVASYVNHRLAVAGRSTPLFPASTINKLFCLSRGIPRVINLLCDRALLGAYVQGQERVDKHILEKAAFEISGESEAKAQTRNKITWALAGSLLLGVFILLAATFYQYAPQTASTHIPEPQKPAVSAVLNPTMSTLQWPADQPLHLSKEMSYEALFKQWRLPYQTQKHDTACKQAQAQGLRCLDERSSLEGLLRLNRPVVMKFSDDSGKEFYATLTSLLGQTASFILGTEQKTVDIKEIEQRWTGDYLLLWRAPPHYRAELKPGHRGPEVQWLENQIALVQTKTVPSENKSVFDNTLVRQVKKFQLAEGLPPDGIVGPQTLIHLNTASGSDEPLLSQKVSPENRDKRSGH
jgi:general secretion pathway protein A